MSGAIDFTELKQHVGIERAVELLGVNLKKAGAQLRGPCPVCKDGGDRAFVVTPGNLPCVDATPAPAIASKTSAMTVFRFQWRYVMANLSRLHEMRLREPHGTHCQLHTGSARTCSESHGR